MGFSARYINHVFALIGASGGYINHALALNKIIILELNLEEQHNEEMVLNKYSLNFLVISHQRLQASKGAEPITISLLTQKCKANAKVY